MDRKALIVAGAAGPDDIANGVLARFGFRAAEHAASLATAAARLRSEHFDLVVVPLQGLRPVELSTLERDFRRDANTLLIGTAPNANSELILSALRAGVQEFLTFPPDPLEFASALDRLVRRSAVSKSKAAGITFAVYSAKGGLGTSSVAVNLAAAFAHHHRAKRVSLADFVVVGGDARVLLNLKPAYDIGDLVMKVDRIDDELLFSLLTSGPGGVWTLPSSDNPEVLDLIDANAASSIIAQLRAHFGFVVIDTEHYLSERTLAALDAADRILLVTQLTVPALRSTQRTIELCDRLGYPPDKVLVVVNRHNAHEALSARDAEDVLRRRIYWKLPNDYKISGDACVKGLPVVGLDPSSSLGRSYLELAAKLGGTAETNGTGPAPPDNDSRLGRLLRLGRK